MSRLTLHKRGQVRYDGGLVAAVRLADIDSTKPSGTMSNPTIDGIVHLIEETKTYGQKGFRKRLVVIEQDKGRFTNYIPVEFIQDGCDSVDELKEGDKVEVTYRLSGRKWQRDANSEVKFFLSAEAMSFRVVGGSGAPANDESGRPPIEADEPTFADGDDEIPF